MSESVLSLPMAGAAVSKDLRARVFSRPWFHRIDLGNGIVTPGIDDTPRKLNAVRMPENLSGKTVIDIGAYDGFFPSKRSVAAPPACWRPIDFAGRVRA